MKTIVYVHPWEGSFNHAILTSITNDLEDKREKFQVIDLYKDEFNPVFTSEELKLFNRGETPYELVKEYQKKLSQATELIFIFPVWWWDLPAILKGFIDKVMLSGFGFLEDKQTGALIGLLTNIKKTTVISTSTTDKEYIESEAGNAIQGVFINRTLDDLGIKNEYTKWIHFSRVNLTTDEKRKQFLEEIPQQIAKQPGSIQT
ncbi:NAD(P)H-dependent oxidoreductase [Bacillus sp. Au-Bac7]|uniref:NAD(P)H-dependent oxidoreductase n=1 Tax=Bacillus sp. Au-Bac7 TaxID=2906458 RepID=UPI001E4CFCE4|nr:NAD(P)H-dependent oxidoreductase [Bacillus sp. Au-Bac7]MCE4052088.1 NAD(P)H-dependent oxidoreductase [Bacillus sp. Au-Bac7]